MKQKLEELQKRLAAKPERAGSHTFEQELVKLQLDVHMLEEQMIQYLTALAYLADFIEEKLGPIPEPDWD